MVALALALALARQGAILPLERRAWCHWLHGGVLSVRDGRYCAN